METNRLYPIGIQSFEKLRKGNYVYVDKTALIYQLLTTGSYYSLSRPRRFGKSLLLSTIEAYFLGKKELFHGLAIENLEKEWNVHPVLHLDLNPVKYENKESLENRISMTLFLWESIYGASEIETSLSGRFMGVIRRAYEKTGQGVVILIDEYDKPLLQSTGDEALQTDYRNTLKAFYGVLKTMDHAIRFALLTGVTKFGKVSVFSDLNNLNDISLNNMYATICGITQEELESDFAPEIEALSQALDLNHDEVLSELKIRYDGYHFSPSLVDIYNPFSLLNTFYSKEMNDYWFETGTPTYLVELIKKSHYDLYRLANEEISAQVISSIDAMPDNPIPVLYQSGYLTIKDYSKEFKLFKLGFPNGEVESGFLNFLIPYYTNIRDNSSAFEISRFVQEIRRAEIDAFFHRLQTFFADYPYELIPNVELHYQNVLFIVFRLIGYYANVEYHTSSGRIDLVLQTDAYIFVMEFKLEGTAEEALEQIDRKQYAAPFGSSGKQLFKIGVNFSRETRNIEKWIVEER